MQRCGDSEPSYRIQRGPEWLLQDLQLQELSERSFLQWDPPLNGEAVPQVTLRVLPNLGIHFVLRWIWIHVLELLHMRNDYQTLSYLSIFLIQV